MKYKKGTKVEVLNEREVPCGSWWCAEIISGNGHTYSVKYSTSPSDGMGELVERVPKRAIRPCPPPLQGPISWVPGDVVELLYNRSWKLAEVTSVVDASYLFVRLLGSSGVFKVHKSDLRLRQCWQDNRWVAIRRDVRNSDGGGLLKHGCLQRLGCKKWEDSVKVKNREGSTSIEEIKWVLSGGKKKRLQHCLPPPETHHRSTKKLKSDDKEGRHQQLAAVNTYCLQDKVDAVASPQKMMGAKCMHAFLNDGTGLSDMDMERGKPNVDVGFFFARSLEPRDASVCSSSGSNDLDVLCCHPFTAPLVSGNSMSEDADSSCWSKLGIKQSVPTRDLAEKIHNLEFHAYCTTMGALYSYGPITWEQEELMTNLRLELHISNDEHLSVLRHLSSSESDLFSYVDAAPRLLNYLSTF